LNGKALLTAAIAFITKSDGTTTTLGTAAGVTLAADASDAQTALIQDALGDVAAGIASLKGHSGALYALAANAEAAAARMMDTDFAMSSAQLAKFTVLNQSAMAMVAQANQANSALLSVLQ
jgi:flagellin